MGTKGVSSHGQCPLAWAWTAPVVPSLATKEEEEAVSMWPHAGSGAGEENDMGRGAP